MTSERAAQCAPTKWQLKSARQTCNNDFNCTRKRERKKPNQNGKLGKADDVVRQSTKKKVEKNLSSLPRGEEIKII